MSEQQTFGTGPKRKSWFLRHKILTTLLGLFVLGVVVSAAGGGGSTTSTTTSTSTATDPLTTSSPAATHAAPPAAAPPAPQATTQAPAPVAPVAPAAPSKPNDKGWVLQSYETKDDGLGDFGGTARITNSNNSAKTGTFTLTLARNGAQVASLQGSAQSVAPGKTVTVELISQDKYSAAKATADFQTDISYDS